MEDTEKLLDRVLTAFTFTMLGLFPVPEGDQAGSPLQGLSLCLGHTVPRAASLSATATSLQLALS